MQGVASGAKAMAARQIISFGPGNAVNGGTPVVRSNPRPIRIEQFFHRFGSHATLMVVETMLDHDGTIRKRVRYVPWPGL
jgi:hypothetical protein